MRCRMQGIINSTNQMSRFFKARLGWTPTLPDGWDELSLYMLSSESAVKIVEKIAALSSLYETLCDLLQIPLEQYPLTIVRLEVGTLRFLGRGATAAIKLLTELIESALGYLHRQYTDEGRIGSIPRKVEAVESVLSLRDKLKKRDIGTQTIDGFINQASVQIANELNRLLGGEMRVDVDGRRYEIPADIQERLAGPPERKLIEASDDAVKEEEGEKGKEDGEDRGS